MLYKLAAQRTHAKASRLGNMTAPLLSEHDWAFDEITSAAPDRAAALRAAKCPRALQEALQKALVQAFDYNDVRFGREQAASCSDDWRSVVQFSVGTSLFDWFFNARTGYRAHFKSDYKRGLKFNDAIIEVISETMNARIPDTFGVTQLDANFQYCGTIVITRKAFIVSLASKLSKIWLCSKRIGAAGEVTMLPFGTGGPKIRVGMSDWVAFYQDADAAWLKVKGAFCGHCGLYQPKGPIRRAQYLQQTGTA
jgi:hypothetical protein